MKDKTISASKIRKSKFIVRSLILFFEVLLLIVIVLQNYCIFFANDLEVKPYERKKLYTTTAITQRTKVEIRAMVEDVFNIPHIYIEYTETICTGVVIGRAIPQFNVVLIEKDVINPYQYATTLAHELSHCKYQSVNECYIEYKAIITLIECDYQWLQNVGKVWANQITYNNIRKDTKYDCGYYLIEYYNKKVNNEI